MKCILILRLLTQDPSVVEYALIERSLRKQLDLPFPPYPELQLALSPVSEGDPGYDEYHKAMQARTVVPGLFTVRDVIYRIKRQEFELYVERGFDTPEDLSVAITVYTFGYGFVEDED